ncbi:MAG TPA: TetR family transcriptional regulator [Thermoleophilia bacterium]
MTIIELEAATGVPRSTIYYYVRDGLLPTAQKAAASRAIYTEAHASLLREIGRLKDEGMPLRAIKERLAPLVASALSSDVDLVAEQAEKTRQAILAAAARLFARKGYKRTRVADIIMEVGITPPVFYSHFPSKQELFVESFGVFVGWMHNFLESRLTAEPDPAVRNLARVHGHFGLQALSPDLMSLVRSEALHEDGEMRRVVQKSYKDMTRGTFEDLTRLRTGGGEALPASDELVAFGLLGSLENIIMRASWDDRYSTRDVLWTSLCLFLAVQAVYSGRVDLAQDLARYTVVVEQLARSAPPVPPSVVS